MLRCSRVVPGRPLRYSGYRWRLKWRISNGKFYTDKGINGLISMSMATMGAIIGIEIHGRGYWMGAWQSISVRQFEGFSEGEVWRRGGNTDAMDGREDASLYAWTFYPGIRADLSSGRMIYIAYIGESIRDLHKIASFNQYSDTSQYILEYLRSRWRDVKKRYVWNSLGLNT